MSEHLTQPRPEAVKGKTSSIIKLRSFRQTLSSRAATVRSRSSLCGLAPWRDQRGIGAILGWQLVVQGWWSILAITKSARKPTACRVVENKFVKDTREQCRGDVHERSNCCVPATTCGLAEERQGGEAAAHVPRRVRGYPDGCESPHNHATGKFVVSAIVIGNGRTELGPQHVLGECNEPGHRCGRGQMVRRLGASKNAEGENEVLSSLLSENVQATQSVVMNAGTHTHELVEDDVAEVGTWRHVETKDTARSIGREHQCIILSSGFQCGNSGLSERLSVRRGALTGFALTYVNELLVLDVYQQTSDI